MAEGASSRHRVNVAVETTAGAQSSMTSKMTHRRQSGLSTSSTGSELSHSESVRTAMSNSRFPQEITDYIVDLLHDEPGALRQCCLVCRSWIPRTRKHLFGTIRFRTSTDLEAWKKAFPNPHNSPAHYTHSLGVDCPGVIAAVSEECGWIQSFSNVVQLKIWACMKNLKFYSP